MKIREILEKKEFQDENVSDSIMLTLIYKMADDFITNEELKFQIKNLIDVKIKELVDKDVRLR